jgi:hypothetical protein
VQHSIEQRLGLTALLAGLLVAGAGRATQAGRVCFEAESAIAVTAPMRIVGAPGTAVSADLAKVLEGASGGQAIEVPEGAGKPPEVGGDASFTFAVQKGGTYTLWCRVWWMDGCGNSFTLSIDDGPAFAFGGDGVYKKWHWVKGPAKPVIQLTPGTHTLKVANREDGVMLDQVLLVQERRYVPVDIETVTPVAAP